MATNGFAKSRSTPRTENDKDTQRTADAIILYK